MNEQLEALEQLIKTVKELKGNKIVTLSNVEKQQPWDYDFSEDGTIGYDNTHEFLFKAQLSNAMCVGGSIVIRQFTDIRVNDIPVKRLYGISLCNNNWRPISAKEMEIACSFDAKTGEKIPQEKNVIFAELRQ